MFAKTVSNELLSCDFWQGGDDKYLETKTRSPSSQRVLNHNLAVNVKVLLSIRCRWCMVFILSFCVGCAGEGCCIVFFCRWGLRLTEAGV